MSLRLALLIPLVTAPLHGADFIRQIQVVNGQPVIYDMGISSDRGELLSKPLSSEAAVFQLYATVSGPNNTQTLTKLDEKTIGTFLPAVTTQMFSEDPYSPARTRADKPYGLRITISGMLADSPGVPGYAKAAQVARSYRLYDPVTSLPTGTAGDYADAFVFRNNGTFADNAILQRLPGDRPSKASGEESFTVFLLSSGSGPHSELAKSTIQIWPVADSQILGIVAGKTYNALPPDSSIVLRDLYPKSVTYAQIYRGPQVTGTQGTPLPSTVVAFDTYAPQSANLALTELDSMTQLDGEYTVEVLTITPFNEGAPEILASTTFRVKRSLSVHGMISTME